MKPATERRGFLIDCLIVFSYLALVLFFFSYFLTGENIIAFKDLSRYFYPLRQLMAEQVRAGQLPLWNPYIFCGYPLMATLQVGFFYPLTIIYYLLPFNLAFNYYIILHYFLAACFMYALLRHFRLARSSAYFGGLVFAFSGYLLSVSNMNTSLSSVIWLPLVVLFWDKVVKGDGNLRLNPSILSGQAVAVSSILLAVMFLGGEPTIVYTTVWFLFFYGLVFAPNKLRAVGLLALAVLIFLGLAAVQLIPFAELALRSERVSNTAFDLISSRSFPPRETINYLLPYFFGNSAQMGSYTEALLGKVNQDWLISPYFGFLPLLFIFFAYQSRREKFFLAAAIVALLVAFGRYTPIYQVVFSLPGFSLLRYPVKYLFLVNFCFCLLAAFGFDRLCDQQASRSLKSLRPFSILLVFFVLIGLGGWLFSQNIYLLLAQKYSLAIPRYFFELLAQLIRFNLQSLLNITLYLAVFIGLYWLVMKKKIGASIFIGAVILITAADLLANGASVGVSAKSEVFTKTSPNYSLLAKDRGLYRLFYSPEIETANKVIYGGNYNRALFNAKDNFTADWPVLDHLFDFHGYESVKPREFSRYYYDSFAEGKLARNIQQLSFFNVKYLVLNRRCDIPGLKLLRHKHEYGLDVNLYENTKVLPRAFLLGRGNKPERGGVVFTEYRPGLIVMRVTAKSDKTLFLSEIYYPGWQAYVDGKETKITRANEYFSALKVPAGEHEVKYVYDPLSFKIGAGISLFTCVLLCFIKLGVDDRTFPPTFK